MALEQMRRHTTTFEYVFRGQGACIHSQQAAQHKALKSRKVSELDKAFAQRLTKARLSMIPGKDTVTIPVTPMYPGSLEFHN